MRAITKKRFGQHFLNNPTIVERIVKQTHPDKHDHFIEIGAGPGILTQQLIDKVAHLDVVEIDRDLIPYLQVIKQQYDHLIIHQADALKFDIASIHKMSDKFRLIGNLPYNISTPLIFHLLKNVKIIKDLHFMVQKEVADRITANPGSGQYGRLSIMVQYFCKAETLFYVSPREFTPPPKVTSAIIRLTPYQTQPFHCPDNKVLQDTVRTAFNQRRKMLSTSLKDQLNRKDFEQLNIDPKSRPENLTIADFVIISNFIIQKTS